MAEQAKTCTAYYNGVPFPVSDVQVSLGRDALPEGEPAGFVRGSEKIIFEFKFDASPLVRAIRSMERRFARFRAKQRRAARRRRRILNGLHTRWMDEGRRLAARDYTLVAGSASQ